MKIVKTDCAYEDMPLKSPFGFKGNALTGLWQTVSYLESENNFGLGLGVQSVLWSDAEVFAKNGEAEGNRMMLDITKFALRMARGMEFSTPYELLDALFPKAREYGKQITGNPNLKDTFVLNALVPVDLSAWVLYARENGISDFDALVGAVSEKRHEQLANVPLITYNTAKEEIIRAAEDGICLFKIKIGSDPDKDSDRCKMLKWDKNRLSEIHEILKTYSTPYTKSGRPMYYLDANGRYDTKERLLDFIGHADEIGALDSILILEEPFAEENKVYIGDLPLRVAADESAHGLQDVTERIELGYKAIALKPIAKTLSVTMRILEYVLPRNIACFCADLTVNPLMVEWNKNVAARLPLMDGMNIGIIESNGAQNYRDWDKMLSYHPMFGEKFAASKSGIFDLDANFYNSSGGIFKTPQHYVEILRGDL